MRKAAHRLFLGVDVGTGSARAGIFDARGRRQGSAAAPIQMAVPAPGFAEQSSEDIWRACGIAVRQALREAGCRPGHIAGIGFDATCSLVALDAKDRPVTVSPTGRDQQNVIVWMDHRAEADAEAINRTRHPVLRYAGGSISPEMQAPKLRWIRRNLPRSWKRAARFLDLADFLTYRATGDDTRSLCTAVCKWTYLGHMADRRGRDDAGWSDAFWSRIGLGELAREHYRRIGMRIRPMGEPLGQGLTARSARELGLAAGTPVGVGIIDAHAGGLGMLGAKIAGRAGTAGAFQRRLALIGGTSTCHMAVSARPRFIGGIWGPYFSAMVPGLWLSEGGQSATGALIDHVIHSHAAAPALAKEGRRDGASIYAVLNARLDALARARRLPSSACLTAELHVLPYFHGNRSPRANPRLRGAVSGLTLDASPDHLAIQYLATVQAIAYGTRHILEEMNRKGFRIDTLLACGGGTQNPLFLREHADATGCTIILPREPEAVLLGAAVLGAVAGGAFADIPRAMAAMNHAGATLKPAGGKTRRFHDAKYRVFHRMYDHQLVYKRVMQSV